MLLLKIIKNKDLKYHLDVLNILKNFNTNELNLLSKNLDKLLDNKKINFIEYLYFKDILNKFLREV